MGIVIRRFIVRTLLIALAALQRGSATADEPVSALSAMPFRLNERLVAQARRAAAIEMAKPRDRKQRRPPGLESLETAEDVAFAVQGAISKLHSDDRAECMRGYVQLRYLGEDAFESLVEVAQGQQPDAAALGIELLGQRGKKAIPTLVRLLNSTSVQHAKSAESSLLRLGDPASIPPVIDAWDEARRWKNTDRQDRRICKVLWYFYDARAAAALREMGDSYLSELQRMEYLGPCVATRNRPPDWFEQRFWPEELLPIQQLCRDAVTRRGEAFGPAELQQMRAKLSFPQSVTMTQEICQAFMSFGDPVVVPDVIRTCRRYNELRRDLTPPAPQRDKVRPSFSFEVSFSFGFPEYKQEQERSRAKQRSYAGSARVWLYWVLADLPTPEAIDFVIDSIEAADRDARYDAVTCMRRRWVVPLWIACLDDREMLQWQPLSNVRDAQGQPHVPVPRSHAIYSDLRQLLERLGLPGKTHIVPKSSRIAIDIRPELERVKRWWAEYGDDFLAGAPVPSPELISIEER